MTLEELSKELNLSISSIRTNFPKIATQQLKNGILIEREGKYPNTIYTISKVEPKEVDKSYFSMFQKDVKIIENEKWIECYFNNNYEVSDYGRVRNKKNNKILSGTINKYGYKRFKLQEEDYFCHRLILQSFKPIKNYEDYTVDHINGKRDDNRLENLRWVSAEENFQMMMFNRKELNIELTRLIKKYGYEETLEKLKQL